jgi:PAS domain S-box-containing protein
MDAITVMIEEALPLVMCAILMLDEEGKRLYYGAAPSLSKDFLKEIDGFVVGPLANVCGTAAFSGQTVIVEDALTDPLTADYRHLVHRYGLRACWAVPIFDALGKILGTFAIYSRQPHRPGEDELRLVRTAAHLASIAMERDRSQGALRESESKFRAITQAAADAIVLINNRGKIEYWNAAAERIFGYASGEVIGEDLHLLLAPTRYHEAYSEGFARFMTSGEGPAVGTRLEFVAVRKDGTEFPIEVSTSALNIHGGWHALGIIRDISNRKMAEEERIRLAAAMEQASDNIIITDKDEQILYVNPSFERLTGFTREEIVGSDFRILRSGKHDERFYTEMWETVSSGEVWTGRVSGRMKNGTLREFETRISPIRDGSGEIVNFVSVNRDVTHEVALESQLLQAQKMEAIGTLAGGIAHDFNNILTAIIGYTELSMSVIPKDASIRKHLTAVLDAGLRAKDLVSQILAFSRQSDSSRTLVRVSSMVKEVLKLIRATLPASIELRQEIQSDEAEICADPTQIHQVLMNLCTNAADAMMEKGGTLGVRLVEVELEPEMVERYLDLNRGPYLRLTVTDTGQGIDPEVMERIFDPFFTTKGPGKGTGMGLAVVHGIVKSHGGFITVHSELGKGTTFDAYFPLIMSGNAPAPEATVTLPGGNERILFVDDEPGLVDLGQRMLKSLGYDVTPITNAILALETFSTTPYKFDLVIADQAMPGLTGEELAKELMHIRPDIPIILCTGFREVIPQKTAKAMGIREFVMKPFVIMNLAETIRRVLDGRQ